MNYSTTKRFCDCYAALPEDVQKMADKSYGLLKIDRKHPQATPSPPAGGSSASTGATPPTASSSTKPRGAHALGEGERMPRGLKKLQAIAIQLVEEWIAAGAPVRCH